MKHHDMGRLDGPVLLFGGPYSNVQATTALFEARRARAIAPDHVICTGDVVAYCGAPAATVAQVRASGCHVIAGNCEVQLARGAPDCGCGFDAGSACDLLSDGWYPFAASRVGEDACAWMAGLPDIGSFHHQGARYAVIHGGVPDIARFIWSTSAAQVFGAQWDAVEARIGKVDHIVAGHSGVPFIRDTPRGRWINAGVIGMPPHDGHQQTRFAVLDGGEVVMHRLSYDVGGAVADMQAARLPAGYRDALQSGYWPSEDILPLALRKPSFANG